MCCIYVYFCVCICLFGRVRFAATHFGFKFSRQANICIINNYFRKISLENIIINVQCIRICTVVAQMNEYFALPTATTPFSLSSFIYCAQFHTTTTTTSFYLCFCQLQNEKKKKNTTRRRNKLVESGIFHGKFIARSHICERQLYINLAGKSGHGQNIELRNEEIIVKFPVHRTTCAHRFT